MRIAFYTTYVTPHQIPWAREFANRVGAENFRYIYTVPVVGNGWKSQQKDDWLLPMAQEVAEAKVWLEAADVVISGIRDFDLFERRCNAGLLTIYTSERWFKPIRLLSGKVIVSGRVRLLFRSYRRMLRRLIYCLTQYPNFYYFPIGVHAREDILRYCNCADKMRDWMYVVSRGMRMPHSKHIPLRVFWCGRMIDWKRPDTVVKAVRFMLTKSGHLKERNSVVLTMVGDGPLKKKLQELSKGLPVTILPRMSNDKLREFMREHDIYVMSSDGSEGWGAPLNEALEEGLCAVGTFEAGSSATMLPHSHLYHAGNYKELAVLLGHEIPYVGLSQFTVEKAADEMYYFVRQKCGV